MGGTGAGVPGGYNDLAGELMLNVEVKLLHGALLQVAIFRDEVSGKRRNVGRGGDDWEPIGEAQRLPSPDVRGLITECGSRAGGGGGGAAAKPNAERLCSEW